MTRKRIVPNSRNIVAETIQADIRKADAVREAQRKMLAALEGVVSIAEHCTVSAGVCMCGDDMANHANPMMCGHAPVDMGQYHMDGAHKDAVAAIAAARAAGIKSEG